MRAHKQETRAVSASSSSESATRICSLLSGRSWRRRVARVGDAPPPRAARHAALAAPTTAALTAPATRASPRFRLPPSVHYALLGRWHRLRCERPHRYRHRRSSAPVADRHQGAAAQPVDLRPVRPRRLCPRRHRLPRPRHPQPAPALGRLGRRYVCDAGLEPQAMGTWQVGSATHTPFAPRLAPGWSSRSSTRSAGRSGCPSAGTASSCSSTPVESRSPNSST
jgi:hypothetical protein